MRRPLPHKGEMSTIQIETLKGLVDPSQLIVSLGFSVFYDNEDEIRAPCIIHGGDNKTAFCFRKDSSRFYCFTHGCEVGPDGETDNDIISLVMRVKRCSFPDAVRFLCDLTGFDIKSSVVNPIESAKIRKLKDKGKFVKGMLQSGNLPAISEGLIEGYRSNGARYFFDLGFTKEIIDTFELGTTVDDFGVERGTIPIRDSEGRLVSVSGRRTDGNKEPRYRLVRDFKKRKVLYGLYISKKYKEYYNRTVIIVEGFKALWHVYSGGLYNVSAIMGRVISPEQVNLLVREGFERCILLLDGDDAGKKGMEKSLLLLNGKLDTIPIYLPQDVSPDNVSVDELVDLIKLLGGLQ